MSANTKGSVTVTLGGTNRSTSLPLIAGTIGPDVFDIRKMYNDLGVFTYDPGYGVTASCDSKITYIDGDVGVLLYRGYPIEQLADHSTFLEVAYLLLNGELPDSGQLKDFELGVMRHTMLHEQLRTFYNGFRRDAHPMAVMCGVVGALSAFYHDSLDIHDPESRRISAFRLIAKMPTIAGWAHKYSVGQPVVYPRNDLGYAENFLHMFHAVPAEEYKVNPVLSKAMDLIMILHADHEQNASTSTVRLAGSTGANPFACIAAGIASLWGPAHGGANEAVLKMLAEIGHVKNIKAYLDDVKDKDNHAKLMGFGHRVYKTDDPRSVFLRQVARSLGGPLVAMAEEVERTTVDVLAELKPGRELYTNVEFFAGVVMHICGVPRDMFTPTFAASRTIGWATHVMEQAADNRLIRPAARYVGPPPPQPVPPR